MWLSHNVYEFVGIFVTFFIRLAVKADETEDLARGTARRGFSSVLKLRLCC